MNLLVSPSVNNDIINRRRVLKEVKQLEALNNRCNVVLSTKKNFVSLKLQWSYECKYCHCRHLSCTVAEERKQCCSNGKMVIDENKIKFKLKPFSMEYLQVLLNNIDHLKTYDIHYNNKLRMSFTGMYFILYFYCKYFFNICCLLFYSNKYIWIRRYK